MVMEEENKFLNSPFTENEVKEAVFQMEHNKSSDPNSPFVRVYYTGFGFGSTHFA